MTVKTFIKKYQSTTIEDYGTVISPEFKQFARDFRSVVRTACKAIGAELVSFRVGHYDVSGFCQRDGKYVYFSYSEPRYMPLDLSRTDCMQGILVRTAAGPKDYRGGHNNFINIAGFESMLNQLLR